MKTTVEIPHPLLARARRQAERENTTVRALIEEGLRRVLAERRGGRPFRLRDVSFGKGGLRPEVRAAGWERLRDLAYEGRGS
jgi:hypothetical protein